MSSPITSRTHTPALQIELPDLLRNDDPLEAVRAYYDQLPAPKKIEVRLLQLINHFPPFEKALLATYFGQILNRLNILYFPSELIHPALEERNPFLEDSLAECAKLLDNHAVRFEELRQQFKVETLYSFLLTQARAHPSPSLVHFLFKHREECPIDQEDALLVFLLTGSVLNDEMKMELKREYIDRQLMGIHLVRGDLALTQFFLNPLWICLQGVSDEVLHPLETLILQKNLPRKYPQAWKKWVIHAGTIHLMDRVDYSLLAPFYEREDLKKTLQSRILNKIRVMKAIDLDLITEALKHPNQYLEDLLKRAIAVKKGDFPKAIFHAVPLSRRMSDAELLLFIELAVALKEPFDASLLILSRRKNRPLADLKDSVRQSCLERLFESPEEQLDFSSMWALLSTTKSQSLTDLFAPRFFQAITSHYFSAPAFVQAAKNWLFFINSAWNELSKEAKNEDCRFAPITIKPPQRTVSHTLSFNGLLKTIQDEWIASYDITPQLGDILAKPLRHPHPRVSEVRESLEMQFDVESHRSLLYHWLQACKNFMPQDPFVTLFKNTFARAIIRQLIENDLYVPYDQLSDHLMQDILSVKIPLRGFAILESQGFYSLTRLLNEKCATTGITLSHLLHRCNLLYIGHVHTPLPEGGKLLSQMAIRETIDLLMRQQLLFQTMRANSIFVMYENIFSPNEAALLSTKIWQQYEELVLEEFEDNDLCRMHLERYPSQIHKAALLCGRASAPFKKNLLEHARSAYPALNKLRREEHGSITPEMLKSDVIWLIHLGKTATTLHCPEKLDTLIALWSLYAIEHFQSNMSVPPEFLDFSGSILLMLNQFRPFYEINGEMGAKLWIVSRGLNLLKTKTLKELTKVQIVSSFRGHSKMTQFLGPKLRSQITLIVRYLKQDLEFLETLCTPQEVRALRLEFLAAIFSPDEIQSKDPLYVQTLKDLGG